VARRGRILVLVASAAAAVGAAAWPWLARAVVEPLALVAWLLLRLTVLSVDQRLWWLALVCAVPVTFLLATGAGGRAAPDPLAAPRPPPHPVDRWRSTIARACEGMPEPLGYRWDPCVELLVFHAALERRVEPDHRVHDALRSGELPLPPAVHAFAFPAPRSARVLDATRRWVRRWTGRERADRRRAVAELLSFLEASLELTRDDRHDGPRR
jgi:MFS family permease